MLIRSLLLETFVAGRVVGSSGRCTHVVCVTFFGGRALLFLFLRVLVEAQKWKHDDLVVEKGSEDEEHKSENILPVKCLQSEKATRDPYHQGPARVNGGSLGSRSDFSGGDSTHVEAGNREHRSNCEPNDGGVSLHLSECVARILKIVVVAECACAFDGLHDRKERQVVSKTPHALSANHFHRVKVVISE